MRARRIVQAGIGVALLASPVVAALPAQGAGCYDYTVSGNKRAVSIENTCSHSIRLKVVWGKASDSACTQVSAYDTWVDSRGWPGEFDYITSC